MISIQNVSKSFKGKNAIKQLSIEIAENNEKVKNFLDLCKESKAAEADMAKAEKLGIDTGIKVIHPITEKKLPVWIGNFVLLEYGTGVVMGVPGHDARDYEFAKKYDLNIEQVIESENKDELPILEKGKLVNSNEFDGMDSEKASAEIIEYLIKVNKGSALTQFRLRDWGVSRQRYWGCPIPVIYKNGEPEMVHEKDLPVVLPELTEDSSPRP